GLPFTIYKFRTMVRDAETLLVELRDENERQGPLFKLKDDPRVTRIGRLLRETSIDELPQLVNVIRGEMSLVGPRPALPSEIESFDDELMARHQVKPGITGLWQVHSRDRESFTSYQRLDLFYVENWSLTLDLAVVATTVPAVIGRSWRRMRPPKQVDGNGGLSELAGPAGAPILSRSPVPAEPLG
ncbi:MAG: sugar transferase, partial [Actinobacteria bacterium]|nr:sugar transferase [Actinomycetota bacterium]